MNDKQKEEKENNIRTENAKLVLKIINEEKAKKTKDNDERDDDGGYR